MHTSTKAAESARLLSVMPGKTYPESHGIAQTDPLPSPYHKPNPGVM